jgi:hypothetical protein
MRIIPTTRDEWVALALFPFKAYVVMGLPVLAFMRAWFGRKVPSYVRFPEATHAVSEGYFLCVAIFLLGAAVQAIICRRGSATVTLGFLMLTFLVLAMLWPWGMFG